MPFGSVLTNPHVSPDTGVYIKYGKLIYLHKMQVFCCTVVEHPYFHDVQYVCRCHFLVKNKALIAVKYIFSSPTVLSFYCETYEPTAQGDFPCIYVSATVYMAAYNLR